MEVVFIKFKLKPGCITPLGLYLGIDGPCAHSYLKLSSISWSVMENFSPIGLLGTLKLRKYDSNFDIYFLVIPTELSYLDVKTLILIVELAFFVQWYSWHIS